MSGCPAVAVTGLARWRRGMRFHPFIVDPAQPTASLWLAESAKSSSL